jgi:hypothetical protein
MDGHLYFHCDVCERYSSLAQRRRRTIKWKFIVQPGEERDSTIQRDFCYQCDDKIPPNVYPSGRNLSDLLKSLQDEFCSNYKKYNTIEVCQFL